MTTTPTEIPRLIKQFNHRVKFNIYALSSVVEYFTKNGFTVNACFLDLSKALDKTNHYGFYLKLIKRKIPLI